jgi:hypothetical protein
MIRVFETVFYGIIYFMSTSIVEDGALPTKISFTYLRIFHLHSV